MDFVHHLGHLFVTFHCHCVRLIVWPSNPNMADQNIEIDACKSCKKQISSTTNEKVVSVHEGDLSSDDVKLVMERLGLWNSEEEEEAEERCDGKCKNCRLRDEAYLLLEEKEASLEELQEAFAVFDEDGDGLITAEELQSVMKRMGFEEGKRLEDCKRMIRAYDEDGDGKINLKEFQNMLVFAV